jgi:hypothetical protein
MPAVAPRQARRGRPSSPAALTRFFGRRAEVAELEGVVPEARLVTLVGPPGGGKTRLSLELLARLEGHAVIRVLTRRVARLSFVDHGPHLNNVIHGLDTLRVHVDTRR